MGSEAEGRRREALAGFHCDVDAAVSVVGGKWKMNIVWLLLDRTHRFAELKREIPNVSQKMLTQSLRELEADRMVHREVYREVPPRVEYSLTEFGRTLAPLAQAAEDWGKSNAEELLRVRAQGE